MTPYVAQAFEGSIRNAETLGIPLRRAIVDLDRAATRGVGRDYFGLDPDKPCLLVFGGSKGARRVNTAVEAAVGQITAAGCQILHVVGTANLDQGADLVDRYAGVITALTMWIAWILPTLPPTWHCAGLVR